MTGAGPLIDSQGRVLRDLRVSLTDRCNFRCLYCLPETEAAQNFYRGHWARLPNPAPGGHTVLTTRQPDITLSLWLRLRV